MRKMILLLFFLLLMPLLSSAATVWKNNCQTKCTDGKCNIILGQTYWANDSDNKCKPIKEAKSLLNSNIKCIIDSDNMHFAECLDYNYTHVKLRLDLNNSYNKPRFGVPVKVFETVYDEKTDSNILSEKKDLKRLFNFHFTGPLNEPWIRADLGNIIQFGESSTTIQLQDADTENLDDDDVFQDGDETTCFIDDADAGSYGDCFIKFDITQVPSGQAIDKAEISARTGTGGTIDSGDIVGCWGVENYVWNEEDGAATTLRTETGTNILNRTDVTEDSTWYNWTVTSWVSSEYTAERNNITFGWYMLEDADSADDYTAWLTKEVPTSSSRPYLNITYSGEECTPSWTNTSWTSWINVTDCQINDTINQERNLTQHDSEECPESSNTTFYNYSYIPCNYCSYNVANTSWSAWANISCLINDSRNQSRTLIEYDSNYTTCYAVTSIATDLWNSGNNNTYIEYNITAPCNHCSYNITNTTWTAWINISCLPNDKMNQSRNTTEYDSNHSTCYGVTSIATDLWNSGNNITHYENRSTEPCDYCTPSWTNSSWTVWINVTGCQVNDTISQRRNLSQYDTNYCGDGNTTFYNYSYIPCNYCSYNVTNTTWTAWINISCLPNDKMNQSRNTTEYDSNHSTCYAVTSIASDLWNSGNNITHYENRSTEPCDYCTPSWTNSSWTAWINVTGCQVNDTINQEKNLTQYDSNNCSGSSNTTFYNYSYILCNYCSYNVTNTTWTAWINISCLPNDKMNQSRNTTEYDSNHSTCYGVTSIATDLWNSGNNNSYIEYRNTKYCDYAGDDGAAPGGLGSLVPPAYEVPDEPSVYSYIYSIINKNFWGSFFFIIMICFLVFGVAAKEKHHKEIRKLKKKYRLSFLLFFIILLLPLSYAIPWDISTAAYSQLFSVSPQDTIPQGVFFSSNGDKMYIIGSVSDIVYRYNLSPAWDIASAVNSQNFSVSPHETTPTGIFFMLNGTKMYVIGVANDKVLEYNLSPAWDITSAVNSQNFSVLPHETTPTGIFFMSNGTKMHVVGQDSGMIYEYSLSPAWGITSAVNSQNLSVSSKDSYPWGLFFNSNGDKMYFTCYSHNSICEYNLSSAWNITTAVYSQLFSVSAQDTIPVGIFFKPDGTMLYVVGDTKDNVYAYFLPPTSSGSPPIVDIIIEGGSIPEVLEAWNPSIYPLLISQFYTLLDPSDLNTFFDDLKQFTILFIKYIFRQPASLVPMGGLEYAVP